MSNLSLWSTSIHYKFDIFNSGDRGTVYKEKYILFIFVVKSAIEV